MVFIFLADDPFLLRNLPIYRQIRIVQKNTSVSLRMIQVIAFIGKYSLLAQYRKTMCKTTRNKELTFVLFAQLHAEPLPIRLAALTQINRYVQHPAYRTTNQLRLTVWRTLKMLTAHYTITGT